MDADTISPDDLGRVLRGVGINLLSRDVRSLAEFLVAVFGVSAHQVSRDFALIAHDGGHLQLHSHGSFVGHPLHGLLPEGGLPATAVQIYLFRADPDAAASRAVTAGGEVVEPPTDKPHGLREATILTPEGFAVTAASPLPAARD